MLRGVGRRAGPYGPGRGGPAPPQSDLLDYATAVRERTLARLKEISDDELDKELPFFNNEPTPVGTILGFMLLDVVQHSGQICYLRGHLKGWGWIGM